MLRFDGASTWAPFRQIENFKRATPKRWLTWVPMQHPDMSVFALRQGRGRYHRAP
ncbi:hypothetical protein VITFI_CDS2222 [Vitreoscilla filiformis]|uniref:Uncharacterized protein n=1 Tax=Vitreoscilla filiformis TaxID=63 RepID=A0A221KGR1_VITFI|nr:hypothetical protein VITFI_CDS2222 [Vitreoscilla filiformis]